MGRALKAGLGTRIRYAMFRLIGGSTSGWWSSFRNLLAGTTIDYGRECGVVYDNSIVSASVSWAWKQLIYPRLVVQSRGKGEVGEDIWTEVPNHGLDQAFNRWIYYDRTVLLHSTILHLLVGGNAFWRKVRSRSGECVGFVALPAGLVEVCSDGPGNESGRLLITHYRYRPPGVGVHEDISPSEVVHFRWGMDPANMAVGLSPLYAALRSVYGENAAATLSAALLKNAGLTGIVYSPKEGSHDFPEDPGQRQELLKKFMFKSQGDGAGMPVVLPFAADVHNVGFSPEQLSLDKTRALDVSRICANIGIDPMILGLPSDAKRFANFKEALEASYESTIAPILEVLAIQIDGQVLKADFDEDPNLRVGWDESRVPARQQDKDALFTRAGKAYRQDDLVTKNEARKMIGLGPVTGGEGFYSDAAFDKISQLKPLPAGDSAKANALRRRWRLEESDGGIDSDEPVEV